MRAVNCIVCDGSLMNKWILESVCMIKKVKRNGTGRLSSNHVLDNLIRNHSQSSEGDKVHLESSLREDSCVQSVFKGRASPIRLWVSKLTSPDFEKSYSSLKLPQGFKLNILKAKLLEARVKGQQSRAKASKGSMQDDLDVAS